eukprot:6212160-Pleurochrysis_carterae.AAC.2
MPAEAFGRWQAARTRGRSGVEPWSCQAEASGERRVRRRRTLAQTRNSGQEGTRHFVRRSRRFLPCAPPQLCRACDVRNANRPTTEVTVRCRARQGALCISERRRQLRTAGM